MKRIFIILGLSLIFLSIKAQETNTIATTNWNTLKKSGFYESLTSSTLNSPSTHKWYWGINIGHTNNVPGNVYYNAQMAFAVNSSSEIPSVYVRSTNSSGEGAWAKVLHDRGNQLIRGRLTLQSDLILQTDSLDLTPIGTFGKKIYFGYGSNDNGDALYMCRFNVAANKSDLRINIGDDREADDRFVIGNIHWNSNNTWKDWFVVNNAGRVGIGVSNPTNALDVLGTIRATEVKVESSWADFVFDKDYKLPTLSEVENHIATYNRLPQIPSAAEVKENGVNLGEMQVKLLQKIEELTLYTIAQGKEIQQLKTQNEQLKNQEDRIKQLEEKLLNINK